MATKKSTTRTSKELEALQFHMQGQPGKVAMHATKPLNTQRDLALAYSPGVAIPCLEIQKNPDAAYDYTSKGNYVAVISNGTAVLGLGNLGALAGKPVMEGKSVLFKRFADIDSVDIEVATENPDEFINAVKFLGPTWGGINLEDIKAPECFIIESKLREIMDIPVFHDDQHGTAIISAAGIINVLHLSNKKFKDIKVVVNGAGAAGIACLELLKAMGLPHNNALLCDTKGVIYKGRTDGMNQWKSAHAVNTKLRTLEEAMKDADVFLGLSVKGAVTKAMVKSMAKNPVIFAMANPDPEITPEEVHATRDDAIVATGRSDYENQVNNVMGFPYIFRGALDVRASTINEEMKIAAAKAIAELSREHVTEEVIKAYAGRRDMKFGKHYIIPTPFDSRLIHVVPMAVAKAAVATGVARKPIKDWDAYKRELQARRDPTVNSLGMIFEKLERSPKKVIFAEGEQPEIIRVAAMWRDSGYGKPILIGKEKRILENMKEANVDPKGIEIYNASISDENSKFTDYLYKKLQRNGVLRSDCARMINNDRNVFAASMLACGHGDALITGLTRGYRKAMTDVWQVIKNKKDKILLGVSMVISKNRTIFIADTACSELSSSEHLVKIAIQTAAKVRGMGYEPRVAFLSFSNFGSALKAESSRVKHAVELLDTMKVDFEYDGEMTADVALNMDKMSKYPFCRLTAPANILICPGLHSASIATKLLEEVGNCTVIGPILDGFEKSVQIVTMNSSINDILNMAAIAAVGSQTK